MRNFRVYADHAATTPLCDDAWHAMLPFLREDFGNPSSLHSWARKPREAIAAARQTIAECIGAESREIFFTSGGTESDNWAIKGSSGGLMVSSYEHHAILNPSASEAKRGRDVVYVNPDRNGAITPEEIEKKWKNGIGLASVMAANNEIGVLNDLPSIAKLIHAKGALFHTDAVQAIGHVPINVKQDRIDFLSASAHKFNGPKGVGFLYIRKGLSLKTLLSGGQQESGARSGTENVAAIMGMAAALRFNFEHMAENTQRLNGYSAKIATALTEMLPSVRFPGELSTVKLPGFLSVSIPGHPAEGLMHLLDLKGIAVSTGAACDSKSTRISHVLQAIRIPRAQAKCTIRISLGGENTVEDIDYIINAIASVIKPR